MRSTLFGMMLLILASSTMARQSVPFDDFFIDKTMRVDLYLTGDAREETVTLDRIVQEPVWAGNTTRLLDPFGYGRHAVKVYDVGSNRLIFAQGFESMFGEYKTTSPALAGIRRTFSRPVRFPFPKYPVRLVIERRDAENILHPLFMRTIDPADYHIITESTAADDWTFTVLDSGAPHEKVDLALIAEGYTARDRDKFQADAVRLAGWLFEYEPYKSLKNLFNIRGVFRPSPESGMDEPRQRVYRRTTLNASFNAFDLDRYQLTEESRTLHDLAAQVPYDAIVILVNSKRYGGGSIYGDYCITTVDNERSQNVFVHEFGHSFAGLADEYYQAEVAYNDFYPPGVEPLEPNITRYLNPDQLKWKDLVAPGLPLPTDWGKERVEAIQAELAKNAGALAAANEQAGHSGASEAELAQIREKHNQVKKDLERRLAEVRQPYVPVEDKVGLFEGAGYTATGMYRPMIYCLMITSPRNEFCRVCQRAIRQMIGFICGTADQP